MSPEQSEWNRTTIPDQGLGWLVAEMTKVGRPGSAASEGSGFHEETIHDGHS